VVWRDAFEKNGSGGGEKKKYRSDNIMARCVAGVAVENSACAYRLPPGDIPS